MQHWDRLVAHQKHTMTAPLNLVSDAIVAFAIEMTYLAAVLMLIIMEPSVYPLSLQTEMTVT